MKKMNRIVLLLVFMFSLAVSACGVAQNAVDRYEEMKTAYVQVSTAISNFQLVVDTSYAKIQTNNTILQSAIANNEAAIAAWSLVEAEYQDSQQDVANAKTSAGVLDVSKLETEDALPNSAIPAFALNVQSYTSAIQNILLDSELFLRTMDTTEEALNSIQASGTDWNAAVENYNKIRLLVGSEIVARLVNELGLSDLPSQLVGYQGANANQPITNPLTGQ